MRYRVRAPHGYNINKVLLAIVIIIAACMILFCDGRNKKQPQNDEQIKTKITTIAKVDVFDHEANRVVAMDLDDYMVCVVAAEMPASFHSEALKAQAVSARTYTIYKAKRSGCNATEKPADVCTNSAHCQAFVSIADMKENWGDEFEQKLSKIKRAVDETKGELIIYKGDVIEVFYHASAGGMTEDSGNVFSAQRPYLVSVSSEGEQDSNNYYSQVRLSIDEFIGKLKGVQGDFSISRDDIKNQIGEPKRYITGRVDSIKIGTSTFSGLHIRKIFKLKSTNFSITIEDDDVVFSSIGFGHGVGMSQNGANAMAKDGEEYHEILKHYFSGVEIVDDY